MNEEKKERKQEQKKDLVKRIQSDRIDYNQKIGWLFRPLALCPFPARPLGKRTITNKTGNQTEEFEILWKRRSKNVEVEILGHPLHGVPYGQDILIVLYLAIEARRQGSRKIKVNFFYDFMKLFEMNPRDGRKYRLVIDSLDRISNAKYSWKFIGEESKTDLHFMYIDELNLFCSSKDADQKPLFKDQYILLSEKFFEEINNHKIPFNLDSIRYLKSKPAFLNFYLFLSVRCGQLFFEMIEKKSHSARIFIQYWGDEGLKNQLSTVIIKRPEFRREVAKWLKQTKELWPLCPVRIENDGLVIEISNINQLDVQPDIKKLSGKVMRLQQKSTEEKGKPCPDCGDSMELKPGKVFDDKKLDDYYHCKKCRKIFDKKHHPDLYTNPPV